MQFLKRIQNQYLQLKHTGKRGRGLFAKQNIPINTNILTIQQQNFITFEKVYEHAVFNRVIQDIDNKKAYFALFLAFFENIRTVGPEEQSIKEYVSELPQEFDCLICWQDYQLEAINNQRLKDKIKQLKKQLFTCFNAYKNLLLSINDKICIEEQNDLKIYEKSRRNTRARTKHTRKYQFLNNIELNAIKSITYKQFIKCYAAIISRNVFWQSMHDTRSEIGALVPLLQMFNHSQQLCHCRVNLSGCGQKVVTIRAIEKGEQIYVAYGFGIKLESYLEDYGMLPQKLFASQQKIRQDSRNDETEAHEGLENIQDYREHLTKVYNQQIQRLNNRPIQAGLSINLHQN